MKAASRSLIHAFQVQPKGAGFELVNRRDFANHMLVTDVDFGTTRFGEAFVELRYEIQR